MDISLLLRARDPIIMSLVFFSSLAAGLPENLTLKGLVPLTQELEQRLIRTYNINLHNLDLVNQSLYHFIAILSK